MTMKPIKAALLLCSLGAITAGGVLAQDVPGIELCTAEKTMERRTGCLQSNINFLKSALTKSESDAQRKLDAANRRIEAVVQEVIRLRDELTSLRATVEKKAPAASKDADKKADKDGAKPEDKPEDKSNDKSGDAAKPPAAK